MLYYPFSPVHGYSAKQSVAVKTVWRHLKWDIIDAQIADRISNPEKMHQTYYPLSGEMSLLYLLIKKDPKQYRNFAENIFHFGSFSDFGIVPLMLYSIFNEYIDYKVPILEIDWMLGNVLKLVWAPSISADQFIRCAQLVLSEKKVEHRSCEIFGILKESEKANIALRDNKYVILWTKAGLFFERRDYLIKGEVDLTDIYYWNSRINDNDFCNLSSDRTYPYYPGVLTPYDLEHFLIPHGVSHRVADSLLSPRMFVCLVNEIGIDTLQKKITLEFWTWGKISKITISQSVFEDYVEGFFITNIPIKP